MFSDVRAKNISLFVVAFLQSEDCSKQILAMRVFLCYNTTILYLWIGQYLEILKGCEVHGLAESGRTF